MRIAFTLGGTDKGRSGLSTYVRAVLPEFRRVAAEAGAEVIVVGTAEEFEVYADVVGEAKRCVLPVWADSPGGSAVCYFTLVSRLAERAGADVILYTAANRRLGIVPGVPSVAVVHDLGQLHIRGKYDLLRMAYAKFALTVGLRAATRLVAISEATRKDLCAALKRPREAVDVVLNGVDADRFPPMPPDAPLVLEARAAHGLDEPYLLYVSRLEHPGKNHVRLLRAFAKSRCRETHRLAFVGADWGAKDMIEAEIRSLGIVGRAAWLGFVESEHLPALVAAADAVAMLGLREGFGLPALEALSAARPVFCSNTGALPEVVGAFGALCDPLDEASIARAMEQAAFDEAFRQRVVEGGPAHARALGWNRTAAGLFQACEAAQRSAGALSSAA